MKIETLNDKALVYTPYNAEFVKAIKAVGGARWDGSKKAWSVPANTVGEVRDIMRRIYGETDIPESVQKVNVRLTFTDPYSRTCAPITLLGKTVASAFGRDSGARVGEGVTFIEGKPDSGGSMKNWSTVIPEGAVVILHDVPETIVSAEALPECVTFEIERSEQVDLNALLEEKARLLQRLAEIDAILENN